MTAREPSPAPARWTKSSVLGADDSLRDGTGGHPGALGQLAGGQPVGGPGPAQHAEQIEDGRIRPGGGECAAVHAEQLGQLPWYRNRAGGGGKLRRQGDTVVITGRRPEPLRQSAAELGPTVRPVVCDGTDPAQVEALRAQLTATVDVLVNNAGGNTDFDRAGSDDLASLAAHWRANLEANLLSAVLITAAVADRLTEGGTVISIGSIAADHGAGAYGAAKAGLASWNIDLAGQLGPRGVTANVVAPGYIATTEFFRDHLTDQRRATLIADTRTGRPGTPEDAAGAVAFLASAAARLITGQVLATPPANPTPRTLPDVSGAAQELGKEGRGVLGCFLLHEVPDPG